MKKIFFFVVNPDGPTNINATAPPPPYKTTLEYNIFTYLSVGFLNDKNFGQIQIK